MLKLEGAISLSLIGSPPKKFKANDSASRPPTIIAQFTNKRVRNEIFAKRKKAKEMTAFPVDEMTNLYINENLTQFRKRLFWSTKQTAKAKKFKFFWTTNGQIWIKKNESEDAIPIRCEDDLDSLQCYLSYLLGLDFK